MDISNKTRRDRQITGLAGEFFVAAELLKRDLQTSITLGNAKQIDLLAFNPITSQSFTVQVKALRERNYFPIDLSKINPRHVYAFILLNKPGVPCQYFIVKGSTLINEADKFGVGFADPKFPGIHPKHLKDYENNWNVFFEKQDHSTSDQITK